MLKKFVKILYIALKKGEKPSEIRGIQSPHLDFNQNSFAFAI